MHSYHLSAPTGMIRVTVATSATDAEAGSDPVDPASLPPAPAPATGAPPVAAAAPRFLRGEPGAPVLPAVPGSTPQGVRLRACTASSIARMYLLWSWSWERRTGVTRGLQGL